MPKKPRGINFTDNDILVIIRSIITEKPTYGYRRVCSILNYRIGPDKSVNHKHVYRIMKENNLLHLPFGKKTTRIHDGEIITIRSNIRWCSDGFTISCDIVTKYMWHLLWIAVIMK